VLFFDHGPLGGLGFAFVEGLREEELVLLQAGDGFGLAQLQQGVADVAPVARRGNAEGPQEVAVPVVPDDPAGIPNMVVAVDVAAAGRAV